MSMSDEAKKVFERYLLSIAGRLPLRNRQDIIREIKGTLLDMLDERFSDEEIDQDKLESVLKEFGNPAKVSRAYLQGDYIIGPELLPYFRLTAAIAYTAMAIVMVVSISLSAAAGNFAGVAETLLGIIQGALSVFAILVLVFFVLQRILPDLHEKLDSDFPVWNIGDLVEIPEQKRVKLSEPIASIIATAILISLVTIFIDRLQIRLSAGTACVVYQIFREGFYHIIPLLVFRWSLDILLGVILIIQRVRTRKLLVFEVLLAGFDIGIILLFLLNGLDHFFSLEVLMSLNIPVLVSMMDWLFYGVLILVLVLSVIDIVRKIIQIVRKPLYEDLLRTGDI
jgi:hypothetical protein